MQIPAAANDNYGFFDDDDFDDGDFFAYFDRQAAILTEDEFCDMIDALFSTKSKASA